MEKACFLLFIIFIYIIEVLTLKYAVSTLCSGAMLLLFSDQVVSDSQQPCGLQQLSATLWTRKQFSL